MNSAPKISVVMPFYNAHRFIAEAIESVLSQSFPEFELILIDDASNDGSSEIVNRYLGDSRIRYIKNETRLGIVQNLNKGMGLSKADIIARMDGDDICHPNRFKKQYELLKRRTGVAIVGSFASVIDESGKKIGRMTFAKTSHQIAKECLYRGPFLHPTVMFRKDIIQKVGNYNTQYDVCQDIDFFLRILFSGYQGFNIDEDLLLYRKHKDSTDNRKREKAKIGLEIKKAMIRRFKLKNNIKTLILIHGDYLLSFFPRKFRVFLTKILKKII